MREVCALAQPGFRCERFAFETQLVRALRRDSFDAIFVDIGEELDDRENFFSWLNCRHGDISALNDRGTQPLRLLRGDAHDACFYGVDVCGAIPARCNRYGNSWRWTFRLKPLPMF